jgi:hypothetical protein
MPPNPVNRLLSLPPILRRSLLCKSHPLGLSSTFADTSTSSSSSQLQPQWRGYSVHPAPKAHPAPESEDVAAQETKLGRVKQSSSRWLGETKSRIGKCIVFGLNETQVRDAARITKILGEEWRELVAGRQGFLTGKRRAGLLRHRVVWGEMDSMAHVNNVTYTRYAESARINWASNFARYIDPDNSEKWETMWTPRGMGLILKSIKTEYKFPLLW